MGWFDAYVPLAIFFFPSPPNIDDPKGNFRRLPECELERFSHDTIQKIRIAQAYQDSLEELFSNSKPERMIQEVFTPSNYSIEALSKKVRKYIGVSLSQQFSFQDNNSAFKAWRHALEEAGIFTFKDSFKDRFLSGFCLIHNLYPIIMINNSNSFTRQIFTLMHELGHILFGVNGVTDIDESYLQYFKSRDRKVEIECNQFAAEVLVPKEQFKSDVIFFLNDGEDAVPKLAKKYSVSREVILRRLLDLNEIDENYYSTRVARWNKDYLRLREKESQGHYYYTRISYLGQGFSQIAFNNYHIGKFDEATLSAHLNVKAKNLKKFESYLWR